MQNNFKHFFKILLFLICLILIIISVIQIIIWILDSNNLKKQTKNISNEISINEVKDNKNTEIINQEKVDEENPYWDYIKMNLIDVDFDKLKQKNSSTVGWIKVNGTNINYPFVQTVDNEFYLEHSFDKSYNKAGWIFMDYRNNIEEFDKNNIIYGHGRINKVMFGSLKNILTNGWLNNKDNYVIKLSTEKENNLWQVFSVYKIPTTNDYLQVKFNSDEEFLEFGNMLKNRSAFDFKTNIYENDKILTLSTCFDNKNKLVLHAKLIKKEKK